MNRPALIGLPLSPTFVPALQDAMAALRQRHPKEKDAELLGRLFVAGIISTLKHPDVAKEKIVRIIPTQRATA